MAAETTDQVRRGIEAWNRGDVDTFLDSCDVDVVMHLSLPRMFGGESTVYRGRDAYRAFYSELGELFAELRIEVSEIRDLGDRVVVLGEIRGRGMASGAEVETPIAYVLELRDGMVIRIEDYFDPDEALRAAGLSG